MLLSSTPPATSVKTKHIYLPNNGIHDQDKYECYFALRDFGIDKDYVIHNFEFKAIKNLFGDCQNSKYCIIRESV